MRRIAQNGMVADDRDSTEWRWPGHLYNIYSRHSSQPWRDHCRPIVLTVSRAFVHICICIRSSSFGVLNNCFDANETFLFCNSNSSDLCVHTIAAIGPRPQFHRQSRDGRNQSESTQSHHTSSNQREPTVTHIYNFVSKTIIIICSFFIFFSTSFVVSRKRYFFFFC